MTTAQQQKKEQPLAATNGKPATNGNGATSRLAKVQKGRLKLPYRYVFYGPEGVGKSTLAAHAPSPIWFDVEDGSGRLDVARYMFRDGPGGHVPQTFQDVIAGINDLGLSEHPFQTLVIDTADRLESLIWQHVVARESGKPSPLNKGGKQLASVEDFGFGKGYQIALDEWRLLCQRLDRLRVAKNMAIVFLAHAQIRTFKNPEGDDYDRYHLRIQEKAAGFLKEWGDVTGFCCFEEGAGKMGDGDRAKGFSTGKRLLKLDRTAAFDAKSRLALPSQVELDPMNPWAPLAQAVEDGSDVDKLSEAIAVELARIDDATTTTKVNVAVDAAKKKGDHEALSRYLIELKKRESTKPKEEALSNG